MSDDRLSVETTIIAARAYNEWSVEALCEHLMLIAATIADKSDVRTSQILIAASSGALVDEAVNSGGLGEAVRTIRELDAEEDA